MNASTSATVTSTGGLSITAKNARRSECVANTVFQRARDATNCRYRSSVGCANDGNDPTSRTGDGKQRSEINTGDPFGDQAHPSGTPGKSYKITGISTLYAPGFQPTD